MLSSSFLSWIKSISYTKHSNFPRHFLRIVNCSRRSLFFWLWASRRCFPIGEFCIFSMRWTRCWQDNLHHADHIWIYRQRIVDLLTVVNKLFIHKQPLKTWETDEVNQLDLYRCLSSRPWRPMRKIFIHFMSCVMYTLLLFFWSSWTLSVSVCCDPSLFFRGVLGNGLMP